MSSIDAMTAPERYGFCRVFQMSSSRVVCIHSTETLRRTSFRSQNEALGDDVRNINLHVQLSGHFFSNNCAVMETYRGFAHIHKAATPMYASTLTTDAAANVGTNELAAEAGAEGEGAGLAIATPGADPGAVVGDVTGDAIGLETGAGTEVGVGAPTGVGAPARGGVAPAGLYAGLSAGPWARTAGELKRTSSTEMLIIADIFNAADVRAISKLFNSSCTSANPATSSSQISINRRWNSTTDVYCRHQHRSMSIIKKA